MYPSQIVLPSPMFSWIYYSYLRIDGRVLGFEVGPLNQEGPVLISNDWSILTHWNFPAQGGIICRNRARHGGDINEISFLLSMLYSL